MNPMKPICWCGNIDLTNFSSDYFHCSQCDTLIVKDFPQKEISRVSNDEEDFYGKRYWLSHQTEELGLQSIQDRSRTDLLDRCGYWLKTLLKYRVAPCRLLDIGCSHGAFVALTELAGHTSTGLELSPWVVEYARNAFHVHVLPGPLEDQNFAGGSFDVVTLFDVVEHLQYPRRTIEECARILSADGILIIQTPCLPTDVTLEMLRRFEHPFLKMMMPAEHLFLFSRRAILRLLKESGLRFVEFEKAPFGEYDMLLVASRLELKAFQDSEGWEALQRSSNGRLLDGYIAQDAIIRDLNGRLVRALNDANARMGNVMKMEALLKESKKHRADAHLHLEGLYRRLEAVLLWFRGMPSALQNPLLRSTSRSKTTMAAKDGTQTRAAIQIGVDLTPILPGFANGGAKSATLELIKTLLRDFADEFHLTLFLPEIAFAELSTYFSDFSDKVDLKCTRFGPPSTDSLGGAMEELKSQTRIRRGCREKSIQVFYSPFGRFLSLPLAMPFIAQVHDLIHLDYPQSLRRKDRLWRHFNLLELSLRGAIFQVSSEFTRRRLHVAYSVPLDRIERTYLPIHGRFAGEASPRDGAYFLYPARAWPHKNHEKLLHAHGIYRQRFGARAWDLVLTGGQDGAGSRLRSLASNLNLGSNVKFMGEVKEEELSRIYRTASALIFPSRYEGFGNPLIEAMHFGLPIICGRTGSQPEVAGDAALYVDVEDPEDIARAMARLTEDKVLRERLTANGRLQLQAFALETEIEKLTCLFAKCSEAKPSSQRLRRVQTGLAILFLEFLYAATALIPGNL
jgi:glycosyltransferase involved in cell wall biosynthesis/2-polyprenyl-3-methyl-5-hydroxy-6-metoxy-1,4-benzoquinol methylase